VENWKTYKSMENQWKTYGFPDINDLQSGGFSKFHTALIILIHTLCSLLIQNNNSLGK
jgi:hypothetical protein